MPRAALVFLMTVATALVTGWARAESLPGAAGDRPEAAAAAAERGWFGLARELWQQGGGGAHESAGFLFRLDQLEREIDQVAVRSGRALASRWTSGPCRTPWRRELVGTPVQGPPAVAAGLVLWNTGAAVHAVRLEDGMPPWRSGSAGLDTRLFPRGSAAAGDGPAATALPAALCAMGGRAYAAVDRGASGMVVCLDLSPAAEGRLVWLVDVAQVVTDGIGLPEGPLRCDGPPLVDQELCCIVLRTVRGREELVLAVFSVADGRLEWTRRCGTAIAADGIDHARGRRRPVFLEDRIVVATHAGTVVAFERDGRPAWRTQIPAAAARTGTTVAAARQTLPPSVAMPDALAAGGLVIVAPRDVAGDAGSVVAIEARGGAVEWRWAADDAVVGLLGPAEGGVVAVTREAEDATGLVRLHGATGREAIRTNGVAGRSAGPVAMIDSTLFQPRFRADEETGAGIVLDAFDPVSLAPRPLPIGVAAVAAGDDDAGAACFVAGGSGVLAVTLPGAIACIRSAADIEDGTGATR